MRVEHCRYSEVNETYVRIYKLKEASMSALPEPYYTPEEYLESERRAERKSEYYCGQIYAMAGASLEHNRITRNILFQFQLQMQGRPCESFTNDLRVRVEEVHYTYPDVVALCGEPEMDPLDGDTLVNPMVIIEVLSPSTEDYDRGRKFVQYRKIETLTDYVVVAQGKPEVVHHSRQQDGRWLLADIRGLDGRLILPSIGCVLSLSDVYANVEFND